jgi:DNA-binding MarR family transcriptional regulator
VTRIPLAGDDLIDVGLVDRQRARVPPALRQRAARPRALDQQPHTQVPLQPVLGRGQRVDQPVLDALERHVLESSVHRPAGLSWAAYRLMFAMRSAGPQTPLNLSRMTNVTKATVSTGLRTLERHGFVRREPTPLDGRSVMVHLTSAGQAVLAQLIVRTNEREVDWAGALEPDEREAFVRLLHKVRRHEPRPPAAMRERLVAPARPARRAAAR